MENLVTDCGKVDSDVLDRQDAKVKALFCNLGDPLVKIYNKLEDLVEIARIGGSTQVSGTSGQFWPINYYEV